MGKGVIDDYCGCRHKVSTIWLICVVLVVFFCFFQLDLQNSWSHRNRSSRQSKVSDIESLMSNAEKRSKLYDEMAADLDKNGARFLKQGETSQSLNLSDLFTFKDGIVRPVLRAMDPPVRANVLHLSPQYTIPISEAVKNVFLPYFDGAIWFQNSSMYHFSMFHASHHISPVPAIKNEVEAEADSVKAVAETFCPLHIILDRVILMSSSVLLGCWQVVSGEDPVTIRSKLKAALPHAPEKQLYNEVMLHTSFARLLGPAENLTEMERKMSQVDILHNLVGKLNGRIRGYEARVWELWYVEEQDLLALALNGRMKIRKFPLRCSNSREEK